ncbi:helix-turn-helix domain-containing protein [Saccharicrinis fermentans]|uniref:Helix-turn-helix protein n=1 Tax=Saccharicrinis fermentans DSM 9555 = JCM 21142 TaxID=869213 RepID=W7XVX1_9BACT|nr:helix-turn-helix transcriptional regulator [Saccharicrinis fermentans]GAF02390.1 helix-turn-helix protein [Saccharicrinis fermentans DSM 9555 = JCM 21142]
MKQRLQTLLATEKIVSSRFADIVGVNRSSISHLLNGRNNPSLEFLQKVLVKFPHINPDWLLLGQGSMYRNNKDNKANTVLPPKNLFEDKEVDRNEEKSEVSKPEKVIEKDEHVPVTTEPEERAPYSMQHEKKVTPPSSSQQQLDRIVFFYSDGTFDTYRPNR